MYKHYFLNEETMEASVLQTDKRLVLLTGAALDAVGKGDVVYTTEGGERALTMFPSGLTSASSDKSYRPLTLNIYENDTVPVDKLLNSDRQVAILLVGGRELPEKLSKHVEVITDLNKLSREEI